MKVRYTQWSQSDRWTAADVEGLITKLLMDGWRLSNLAENANIRRVWFGTPHGDSGIDIEVRKEDVPA